MLLCSHRKGETESLSKRLGVKMLEKEGEREKEVERKRKKERELGGRYVRTGKRFTKGMNHAGSCRSAFSPAFVLSEFL